MEDSSEKSNNHSEGKTCSIAEAVSRDFERFVSKHAAVAITNGDDETMTEAGAHVAIHVAVHCVNLMWAFKPSLQGVASALLKMVAEAAKESGISVDTVVLAERKPTSGETKH